MSACSLNRFKPSAFLPCPSPCYIDAVSPPFVLVYSAQKMVHSLKVYRFQNPSIESTIRVHLSIFLHQRR